MDLQPSVRHHYWVDNLDPWLVHFYARTTRLGLMAAVVCNLYALGRFVDEFWREPDFVQPVYWGWMSKGQLLTIPVIVIGIFLAIRQFQQGAVPKG